MSEPPPRLRPNGAPPPNYTRRRILAACVVAGLGAGIGFGIDSLLTSGSSAGKDQGAAEPGPHGLISGTFSSVNRRTDVGWTVSFPPSWRRGDPATLCLVLHGFSANHTDAFDDLRLQDAQAALPIGSGHRPLVLAAADGGNGYWHPRANGDNPQAMLLDEFLPVVARLGVPTNDLVAFGWSMGGYGALLLAETYPDRIRRVGAESPAIWPSYAASQNANPDAFDSSVDWSRNDVVGHLAALGSVPVHINCGWSDPFLPASRQLATLLPAGAVVFGAGGHNATFWNAHALEQLRFLSTS